MSRVTPKAAAAPSDGASTRQPQALGDHHAPHVAGLGAQAMRTPNSCVRCDTLNDSTP